MAKDPVTLIALGGNALIHKGEAGTADEQLANMRAAMRTIAGLARDHRLVITHGNGPQVGNLLLQQECTDAAPHMPLHVVGAMTQGQIGFLIESSLDTALADLGLHRDFLTILTFTEVDAQDPLLLNPTKPIGPTYTEEEATRSPHRLVKTDAGYRRVVASPRPVAITQHREIKQLVNAGYIVICAGGGGIPVVRDGHSFRGVEAVVDKDLASSTVARLIGADLFVIATDVKGAAIESRRPGERLLRTVQVADLKRYFEEGHFPPGSMGPKVEALIGFVEGTGNRGVVCHLDDIEKAVAGRAGTQVLR
jgi:carbamate kinase